jgi:hypothetical protein
MSDAQIARIEPVVWKTRTMELPVPPEVYAREGIADTSITHQGKITWRMANTLQYGQTGAIRVQDIVVLDILRTNKWKRPIYFAVTCGPDSRIGLSDYLRLSGFAFRLVPAPASRSDMGIDPDALRANLFTDQQGFSRTPRYGFKISSTGDTTVFLDETDERMAALVRSAFRALAHYELEGENDPAKAAAVLQRMDHRMPLSRLPLSLEEEIDFALLYSRAGMTGRVDQLAPKVDEQFKALTSGGPLRNPYLYEAMLQLYEARGDFSGALSLLGSLKRLYPNDPSVQARIDTLRAREARAGEGAR